MLWSGCPMTGPRTGSRLCWRTRCRHCRSCPGTASPGIRAKRCRRTRRSPSRPGSPSTSATRSPWRRGSGAAARTRTACCASTSQGHRPARPLPKQASKPVFHPPPDTASLRDGHPDAACPSMPPWVDGAARQPAQQRRNSSAAIPMTDTGPAPSEPRLPAGQPGLVRLSRKTRCGA